jgi:hypothetical protein
LIEAGVASFVVVTVHEDAFHIDDATAAALYRRVEARVRRGDRPSAATLPEQKSGYPRLLCLDMNKWIALARAHYERPDAAALNPVLASIRRAVADGEVVVPVLAANAREAMSHSDEGRRRRLAEFMVSLSGNQSLVNDVDVIIPEMDCAISRLWRGQPPRHRIRSRLVQRGMIAAIQGREVVVKGVEEPLKTILTEVPHEPEISVLMLMNARTREDVARSRQRDLETASKSMKIRGQEAAMTMDARRRVGSRALIGGGAALGQLRKILAESGDDALAFFEWLSADDNAVNLEQAIPGIDVMSELIRYRNRNPAYTSHPNDARDLSFLRVAVPYANIVVVEKSWGHFVQTSGIADRYDTCVTSDLMTLPALLASSSR